MSLVDLQSDLSKFRSEVSREPKSTPESSKATNNKNFATVQPITAKLAQFSKPVQRQEPKQLETKLGSTKLDDVQKFPLESVLLNTVSRYSAINEDFNDRNVNNVSLENVVSRFDDIRREEIVSRLTESKIVITRQNLGQNNLTSPVQINNPEGDTTDNIVNPNIEITRPEQSFDRNEQSPNLTPARSVVGGNDIRTAGNNVTNPNIPIERVEQSLDRTKQSVIINKDLISPLNNVIDPKIALERSELTLDRETQSPNIITDTVKQGLVVDPDIKVIRIEQGTFNLTDESNLNVDGQPIRFVGTSELINLDVPIEPDTERYNTETIQSTDNSILNLDTVTKTNPTGRHESPEKSGLSVIGTQQVNFFPDSQVKGFVVKAQTGVSYYTGDSIFGWSGNKDSAPTTNFIEDVNGRGFRKFASIGETDYNTESSTLGFIKPPETNFFDVTKNYVTEGFKTFVTAYQTAYKQDSSVFTWTGKKEQAPETNYFDETSAHSNAGFHKFAQIYDTKFIPDSSVFDWDGNRDAAPESNFFDLNGSNTNAGFHRFAQLYDSKYIADSSQFDWDGSRTASPETNFFDVTGTNSSVGFHKFAQLYDSKYVLGSSQFDWDGSREDSPENNFFDIDGTNSSVGFHKFAQLYDSKFVQDSSNFDWDGTRDDAPEVNYFDITGTNTGAGFHKFAQLYDSKYSVDSSAYNWDGNNQQSPEVNYFDVNNKNTGVGFHRFAQLYDSKYIVDSSAYNWDGNRQQAPEINYFDVNSKNAIGFHKFAQIYDTKFVNQSSEFDWDGSRSDAPEVNYFDIDGSKTSTGFHKFAQIYDTKYVRESSIYDWDGTKQNAPEVNYFDLTNSSTTKGFEKWSQSLVTRYVRDASRFTFKGSNQSAPEVDYLDKNKKYAIKGFERFVQRMVTKYVKDSSEFTFKGASRSAPKTNFFPDTQGKGFTTFPEKLNSEYSKDVSEYTFKGGLPKEVNFFSDSNVSGFVNKTPLLETKFEHESSEFAFKGSTPEPIDFLSNTNASGFDIKIGLNETKFVDDSSKFTFKGDGKSAKTTNFFGDTSAKGFTSFPQSLVSEYVGQSSFGISGGGKQVDEIESNGQSKTSGPVSRLTDKDSSFDWKGSRRDAPEVDYFKIQGTNPNGIEGFTKLFDNTETKLTDEFSRFSFASVKNLSPIKKAPYTTFFGYTPSERTGFMAGMSAGDSTLYPIIDPVLKYDEIPSKRFEIEGIRGTRKRLQTANREKYAPLSLGKRPWVDGTLSATLENQVPNLITGGVAGSYENKYERGVKDNTEQKGYLTKWAITRRSPSELDKQYSKFNLRNDSFNFDLIWSQPFVLRGIQGGLEPERWGGILRGADEGVARGGIATQLERVLFDEQRIGKYLTSIKGIAWNLRQVGLQLMNPVVDVDPKTPESSIDGYSSTHIFNPLSVLANVATARVGFHVARHGSVSFDSPYLNKYETATVNRELMEENKTAFASLATPTLEDKTKYNRLIGLMKELLPNSFSPYVGASPPSPPPSDGTENPNNDGVQSPNGGVQLNVNSQIVRISSKSRGPQSKLGIGETTFNRASHPYLTHYTTTPNLTVGDSLPAYLESAKRDTFYSVNTTYGQKVIDDGFSGNLSPGIPQTNIQKDTIDRISNSEVFSPKYDTKTSRVQRITKDSISKTQELLAYSNHPDNLDRDSLIKKYRVTNYDRIGRNDQLGNRFFNDFRHNIELDWSSESGDLSSGRAYITNPNIARFGSRNLSERYGFGDQGRPGVRRDTPFLSTINYKKFSSSDIIRRNEGPAEFHDYPVPFEKDRQYFRGDRINIIDYKRANFDINTKLAYELDNTTTGIPGTRDLIEFYFSSLVISGHKNCPAEIIVFRATFGNITDNHKPSWNAVKYMGRADPLYTYQGYEREISFDFTVHIGSRDELRASWRKLNYLASWTAPEYRNDGTIRGPMIRLNIGHLYRKMPGYISSLSYTFDNTNTNWETAKLPEDMNLLDPDIRESSSPGALQLPKHIDVSVSFVPVGVYRPEFRGIMYSLYDDSAENGNVETGLMPTNGNRVNYFIEYFEDNKPVIYTGTTVDKNGKRVSYAGDPIQSIEPAADTIPAKTGAKAEGTATNSTDKPGTATSSNTATTETTSTTTTEDTATTEQRSPILTDPNAGIPSFLQNENSAGTNDTNTPPPIGNTPDSKTTNSKPIVTSPSTITPSITAVEEKIFQLAVVGTNPVKLYPYVGERGIWFAVGASNANKLGYGAFGPGKDAAIAYIRSQIGVKEDGTTNATDQG